MSYYPSKFLVLYRAIICWVRDSFGFSRTEANGYLVLITLLMIVHFGVKQYPYTPKFDFEDTDFQDSISQILSAFQDTVPLKSNSIPTFNPNTIAYDSLILWGLDPFVAANMIKYRKAGGRFDQPEDLKKIFGMTDSIWLVVGPKVDLVPMDIQSNINTKTVQRLHSKKSTPHATTPKDLNKADSIWLKRIYGIGPVLSKRIIKYRDLLGGFYSTEQLNEVYGLSPEVLANLKRKLFIQSGSELNKIDLNIENFQQIASHPYITFNQAKAIVAYRDRHGSFKSVEELKKIHLIDDSTYLRVYPYLDF